MKFKKMDLPTERKIVPEGTYLAVVKQTNIRIASTGNKTLNMLLQTNEGQLWDMVSESTNQNALFKINRLLVVTGVDQELPDEFTLEQLAPLLVNKSFGVRVVHQLDLNNQKRSAVGFNDMIYLNAEQLKAALEEEAQIKKELNLEIDLKVEKPTAKSKSRKTK